MPELKQGGTCVRHTLMLLSVGCPGFANRSHDNCTDRALPCNCGHLYVLSGTYGKAAWILVQNFRHLRQSSSKLSLAFQKTAGTWPSGCYHLSLYCPDHNIVQVFKKKCMWRITSLSRKVPWCKGNVYYAFRSGCWRRYKTSCEQASLRSFYHVEQLHAQYVVLQQV